MFEGDKIMGFVITVRNQYQRFNTIKLIVRWISVSFSLPSLCLVVAFSIALNYNLIDKVIN